MPEVIIHDKTFVPYIRADKISSRVAGIADAISVDYAGKEPLFICILNGAFVFAADLLRHVTIPAEISFIKLSSYSGISSSGVVTTSIGLTQNIAGRHIIILEDIVDTGKTLNSFLPEIRSQLPASVAITSFLTKPDALQYEIRVDYTAFEIDNKFVVGYGLDYNGLGRNLPDLYILKQ